jgi:DnaJ-class molecular chaperone
MASKDYYSTLGVPRDASDEAIRTAYRNLARKHHPDVNPGDSQAEERFKEIAEAYAVLADSTKRQQYDTRGPEEFSPGIDLSEFMRRARAGGANPIDLGALFGDLFSGGGGAPFGSRARRGPDVEASLRIEFRDAVEGVTLPLQIQRSDGGAPRPESITVRIPPGVSDGGRLRIAGKGQPGRGGGPPGDLYVRIQVRRHPFFRQEGEALICRVPLTVVEATLGGQVTLPTLDGETTMTVPAGTQSGQRFRIKGKGVPNRHGKRGPLYVDVRIVPPKEVDAESRRLMEEFAQRNPQENLRARLLTGDY